MLSWCKSLLTSLYLYSLIPTNGPNTPVHGPNLRLSQPQVNNNELDAFSGAVYVQVVNDKGISYSLSSPAQCPVFAPQNCENVNSFNWCCPTDNSCSQLPNNIIGCCPAGSTCNTNGPEPQIKTVILTITSILSSTLVASSPDPTSPVTEFITETFVKRATSTCTTNGGGVLCVPLTGGTSTSKTVITGACSTLTMHGSPLPTLFHGYCSPGVAIVNAGVEMEHISLGLMLGLWFVMWFL